MANRRGRGGSSDRFPLLGLQNHRGRWLQPWNQKMFASWQESNDKCRWCVEKQRQKSTMVFPVVVYSCESWTVKAERQRIHAFELWCCRRLLKVPWTARRSNQSILREISPELEELMLKLKPQYFGHLMCTDDSLEKSVMLGKIEGRRRRGCQRMKWLDSITEAMNMNLGRLREILRDWTTTNET